MQVHKEGNDDGVQSCLVREYQHVWDISIVGDDPLQYDEIEQLGIVQAGAKVTPDPLQASQPYHPLFLPPQLVLPLCL